MQQVLLSLLAFLCGTTPSVAFVQTHGSAAGGGRLFAASPTIRLRGRDGWASTPLVLDWKAVADIILPYDAPLVEAEVSGHAGEANDDLNAGVAVRIAPRRTYTCRHLRQFVSTLEKHFPNRSRKYDRAIGLMEKGMNCCREGRDDSGAQQLTSALRALTELEGGSGEESDRIYLPTPASTEERQRNGTVAGTEKATRRGSGLRRLRRRIYEWLSLCSHRQGSTGESVASARLAVSVDPFAAEAWQRLGEALRGDRQFLSSLRAYEISSHLAPAREVFFRHVVAALNKLISIKAVDTPVSDSPAWPGPLSVAY
eukprot:GHVU01177854.1.p1 GENE.GHVU01177854.1~~GHVU01177854.1.p1  ORF type:complete len:313 (+),score=31.64 GHVU01177854.1:150-1088(+)